MRSGIVSLDIETSLDILAAYGLKEQYHSPENIISDWFIICFAYKYYGRKKIFSVSLLDDMDRFLKNPRDDYFVVKMLHEIFSSAAVVIGHNVTNFDWKMFYARVMFHRLPAIDKPLFIDTLKIARSLGRFTSNTMKYLARYFKLTPKMEHSKGMGLDILLGSIPAIKECVRYCRGDIMTTEEMYEFFLPYITDHPWQCPECGKWLRAKQKCKHKKTAPG